MSKQSLYSEIDKFIEDYIERVKDDGHFVGSKVKSGVRYALRNTLGHIRALKECRDLKKQKP